MYGALPAKIFLSTLSLRRATVHYDNYNLHCVEISIHALLAESDWLFLLPFCTRQQFLSTLSLRRATLVVTAFPGSVDNFYPRSPCGERPEHPQHKHVCMHFYPRSPCGERPFLPADRMSHQEFLSTLSLRRATPCILSYSEVIAISIHALLAESDSKSAQNSGALLRI